MYKSLVQSAEGEVYNKLLLQMIKEFDTVLYWIIYNKYSGVTRALDIKIVYQLLFLKETTEK